MSCTILLLPYFIILQLQVILSLHAFAPIHIMVQGLLGMLDQLTVYSYEFSLLMSIKFFFLEQLIL